MKWLIENYMVIVFLLTTLLAVVKAILLAMGKKKAAEALEKVKEMLHQTFGNVEALKVKWEESGMEKKYGKIGKIFATINEENKIEDVMRVAYTEWQDSKKEEWKP